MQCLYWSHVHNSLLIQVVLSVVTPTRTTTLQHIGNVPVIVDMWTYFRGFPCQFIYGPSRNHTSSPSDGKSANARECTREFIMLIKTSPYILMLEVQSLFWQNQTPSLNNNEDVCIHRKSFSVLFFFNPKPNMNF